MALSQRGLFSESKDSAPNFGDIKKQVLEAFQKYISELRSKADTSHYLARAAGIRDIIEKAENLLEIYAILQNQKIIFSERQNKGLPELNLFLSRKQVPLTYIIPANIPFDTELSQSALKENNYYQLILSLLELVEKFDDALIHSLQSKQIETPASVTHSDSEKFKQTFAKMKADILACFSAYIAKPENIYFHRVRNIRAALAKVSDLSEMSAILQNQQESFEKIGANKLSQFGGLLRNVEPMYRVARLDSFASQSHLDLEKDSYYQLILASKTIFENWLRNPLEAPEPSPRSVRL